MAPLHIWCVLNRHMTLLHMQRVAYQLTATPRMRVEWTKCSCHIWLNYVLCNTKLLLIRWSLFMLSGCTTPERMHMLSHNMKWLYHRIHKYQFLTCCSGGSNSIVVLLCVVLKIQHIPPCLLPTPSLSRHGACCNALPGSTQHSQDLTVPSWSKEAHPMNGRLDRLGSVSNVEKWTI